MAQQRKRFYNQDEQTHFAKKHSLLDKQYMSDFDAMSTQTTSGDVTFNDSENQRYFEYKYTSESTPLVTRFIETKSRKSGYITDVLNGEIQPSEQFKAYATLTTELNAFRKANKMPIVECLLVIEDFGEYPYEIYRVSQIIGGEVQFEFIGKVYNDEQYREMFQQ
jgi:hypothetical protein